MPRINQNIMKIQDENEFMKMSQYVKEYQEKYGKDKILSLGIGDVSFPIISPVIEAMHRAVDDLARMETFHGYGTSSGYDFLKQAILQHDYHDFGFSMDEIYISNGTKTDASSILELFDIHAKIGVINPVYPIYRNGAFCLNREVTFLTAKEENQFIPTIPNEKLDIVYLCSPNNPVGNAYTVNQLKTWVDYARENQTVILYDNAYYQFIQSEDVPHSIYEIEGAKEVAIEMRSFSKAISFSGVRCSYYVIPKEIYPEINTIWKKRTINRFNGADYIAQRGAEAAYLPEAQAQIRQQVEVYHRNTKTLLDFWKQQGHMVFGGVDSPFLWVKTKENKSAWEMFEDYLHRLQIVITPGNIFGEEGNHFIRISGLASEEVIHKAIERIQK